MTRRLVQLILGLSLYGAAVGVMVRAGLGLGGTVGVGALLYAVSVGPLVAIFLPLFHVNRSVQAPAAVNL